jgi:transposase
MSKSKFESKIMVWIAISSKGHSKPYFARRNCSITSDIYIDNCLKENLKPFLEKYHSNNNYMFWPDGATAHYSRKTIDSYHALGIKYLSKDNNPPNIPQLRPIETFWAHLKSKVYSGNWTANNDKQLIQRIRFKLKEFSPEYFERLMKNIKINMRKAADYGHEFKFK